MLEIRESNEVRIINISFYHITDEHSLQTYLIAKDLIKLKALPLEPLEKEVDQYLFISFNHLLCT